MKELAQWMIFLISMISTSLRRVNILTICGLLVSIYIRFCIFLDVSAKASWWVCIFYFWLLWLIARKTCR